MDGSNWTVDEPLAYDTEVGTLGRIVVPAGFTTDFASIPRFLWSVLPPAGAYGKAAVVHDFLYRTRGPWTRGEADAVLKEAMGVSGVGWFTRQTIWLGVRTGGHFVFKGGNSAD